MSPDERNGWMIGSMFILSLLLGAGLLGGVIWGAVLAIDAVRTWAMGG